MNFRCAWASNTVGPAQMQRNSNSIATAPPKLEATTTSGSKDATASACSFTQASNLASSTTTAPLPPSPPTSSRAAKMPDVSMGKHSECSNHFAMYAALYPCALLSKPCMNNTRQVGWEPPGDVIKHQTEAALK